MIDSQSQAIDCFERTEQDWLLHSFSRAGEFLPIPALDLHLELKAIYDDVTLESNAPPLQLALFPTPI